MINLILNLFMPLNFLEKFLMESFETFILLMFAAAILVGIAQKIKVSYPICLVLAGVAIGFTPLQETTRFDPNLILVIVLPPILYYAAFGISFREFKYNLKEILSLALGLVIFNTMVIGILFKWIFPEYPWALAFTFGAIVSPPDAVAAATILKRFSISSRLLTILEGESLINDASALVLYKMTVVALLSGVFSFTEASMEFIKTVSGGIGVGFVLGYIIQSFSQLYLHPAVGTVLSFTIPYITFILANSLGVSGVLAVVVNGLVGSQLILRHPSSLRRILGFASWDIFIVLMNCFIFILIGLQLRTLTNSMTVKEIILYTSYAFLIVFAMVAIRTIWVYVANSIAYFKALNKPNASAKCQQILRESAIISWSGMRGIVSLTAALALPYTLPNGTSLEGRNEVIVITFIVILLTLLIPGLTLSSLTKWLEMDQEKEIHDLFFIRKELTKVAKQTLDHLKQLNRINDKQLNYLSTHFNLKLHLIEVTSSDKKELKKLESLRTLVIQEQRKKLLEIWEHLEIDDKLLYELEAELDFEEIRIARAELS